MATQSQITTARINAQSSTGPRTVEGKERSRFNAMKFGISAESDIIPGENAEELEQLIEGYCRDSKPVGEIEMQLVRTLVRTDWLMRRYNRIEAQVIHLLADPELPSPTAVAKLFLVPAGKDNPLPLLFRRRAAAQRDWFRALRELQNIQKARKEGGDAEVCVEDFAETAPVAPAFDPKQTIDAFADQYLADQQSARTNPIPPAVPSPQPPSPAVALSNTMLK